MARISPPVALVLALPLLAAGCPPTPPPTPTGGPGSISIPAGTATPLPDVVVGRSTAPGPTPCATAIGLTSQVLTTPAMVLTGSPTRTYRSRIVSGGGTYTYAIAPVDPLNCTILPVSTPTSTVTFSFTYIRDTASTEPTCVETSVLTLGTFEPALQNALIRDPFQAALWARLEANALIAPGGRCSNWIETPAPVWP